MKVVAKVYGAISIVNAIAIGKGPITRAHGKTPCKKRGFGKGGFQKIRFYRGFPITPENWVFLMGYFGGFPV